MYFRQRFFEFHMELRGSVEVLLRLSILMKILNVLSKMNKTVKINPIIALKTVN